MYIMQKALNIPKKNSENRTPFHTCVSIEHCHRHHLACIVMSIGQIYGARKRINTHMSASYVSVFCWFQSFFLPNLFVLPVVMLDEHYLKNRKKHYRFAACVCRWISLPLDGFSVVCFYWNSLPLSCISRAKRMSTVFSFSFKFFFLHIFLNTRN